MFIAKEPGVFEFLGSMLQRLSWVFLNKMSWSSLLTEDMQFLALILSGSICVLLGFYLVHNRLTMMANSLSHTVLLGLATTFIISKKFFGLTSFEALPLYVPFVASVLTAIMTISSLKWLSKWLSPEASNAFSFTAFFSLGILMASTYLKQTHLGIESVMGNLEAIDLDDLFVLFVVLVIVSLVSYLLRVKLDCVSFDELFAKTIGLKSSFYKNLFIFLSSLGLMVCFRSLGVILILSLLTAPILTARLFVMNKTKLLLFALGFVWIQTFFTLAFTHALYVYYDLPLSTAGVFATFGGLGYMTALALRKKTKGAFFIKKTP